jgi:predicted secreted protein
MIPLQRWAVSGFHKKPLFEDIIMTLKFSIFIFRRKISIPISIITLLLLSCTGTKDGLILTEKDNGKAVVVTKGDTFKLRLKAQLSTGYSWKIINYNDRIMTIGKPEIETLKKDVIGGIDYQIFSIGTRDRGEGEIVLHYLQPWQKGIKPLQTYTIKIRVE